MNNFKTLYLVEWLKIRGTKAIAATIGAPMFVAFISITTHLNYPGRLVDGKGDPWMLIFGLTHLWAIALSTLIISLITYLINNVEHKGEGWKFIYTMPIDRWKFYTAKLSVCLTLSTISLSLLYIFFYVIAGFMSLLYPEIPFEKFNPHTTIFLVYLKLFIASFVIIQIQFLVSKIYNNFMIPLGVGILSTFAVMALMRWKHAHYFPYAYPSEVVKDLFRPNDVFWQQELFFSLGLGVLVFLGGIFWNQKRNIA